MEVLLTIQKSLGSLEASQKEHSKKLDSIHEQVKYTNGRVNILRNDVDKLIDGNGKKKSQAIITLTKEQIAIIGGAILTLSAYILDKTS